MTCLLDPETFAHLSVDGHLHSHYYDADTGRIVCPIDETCEACGLVAGECECLGPRSCPACSSTMLAEHFVATVQQQLDDVGLVPVVNLRCLSCGAETPIHAHEAGR